MSGPFGSSQFMYATGAAVEGQSLRFEDGDSAYLSWTPASAGNRKTWTWSGWVKRGNLSNTYTLFDGGASGPLTLLQFTGDQLRLYVSNIAITSAEIAITSAVFRDPSAWYHIVCVLDTTETSAANRVKFYVNGVQQTVTGLTGSIIGLNGDLGINRNIAHNIGRYAYGSSNYLDGYLANVAFIDGTALDPTSFGEYGDTLWKPKSDTDIQALTFGTNGFYLPFKQTTEAEGFSTVTYTGNGSTQSIEGVGFEPSLVWMKERTNINSNQLVDSVRGVQKGIFSDLTFAEITYSTHLSSFDSSGFTVGSNSNVNGSGKNYVAWCWDAGTGSAVSNTDGSISSTVKANTTNGFSIVSYTGNNTSGSTIGHGLSSAPEMIIVKNRSQGDKWAVYHASNTSAPETEYLVLNSTNATADAPYWADTAPTSTLFSVGLTGPVNQPSENYIAYCFHSVSGYSSIGSYTGNGSATGPTVTTGFKPAFVLIKSSTAATGWAIVDNTRSPTNPTTKTLFPDLSNAEYTSTSSSDHYVDLNSNGFQIKNTNSRFNANGQTFIYMAFADTRDATFFGDTSGNGNNWTPNALNNTDVVLDAPVSGGNFAVLNAVVPSSNGLSEGNLKQTGSGAADEPKLGSIGMSSGKWYWEYAVTTASTSPANLSYAVGVATSNETDTNPISTATSNRWAYRANFSAGDIISVAYDADAQKLWVALNNTWISSGDPAAGTNQYHDITVDTVLPYSWLRDDPVWVLNFGQDSSFAGNETPQGNTDDNGQGDFYYAPPSGGFLALTTGNLPTPTITAPDEYFNTVLYTGTGSSRSITGVNFQPDWIWWKGRNASSSHLLMNAVVGNARYLYSNSSSAEQTDGTNVLTSFDSDGFTLPADTGGYANFSGRTYVAWNWLAGNGTVSNTDGSITSTVSANQDAGFSVATYTGTGANATVGHGLSSAPKCVFIKCRSNSPTSWMVGHSGLNNWAAVLQLDVTTASVTDGSVFNSSAPSSSVVNIGTNLQSNSSGLTYVMYSFAEIEGYSKFGSYTGNGSTDGTFVHCGFRPAFVIVKRTDSTGNWIMYDNKRPEYNSPYYLLPNTSFGGDGSDNPIDFLSNGFKLKTAGGGNNVSSGSYIFLAFAEAPFKSANAR